MFLHLNHSLAVQGSDQLYSFEHTVSITNEQNIICRKTRLGTVHDQSITSKQLRTGKFRGGLSIKDKYEKMPRMIIALKF